MNTYSNFRFLSCLLFAGISACMHLTAQQTYSKVYEVDCRNALLAPQVGVIILDTNMDPGTECMNGGRERAFINSDLSDNVNKVLYDQMDLIGSSIIAGDFDDARVVLNQIDQSTVEGIDAKFIGENLIQLYEDLDTNNDNSNLVLNLKSIAMKEHPSSGYAQAFHYYLTGEFVDNLDLSFLDEENVNDRNSDLQKKKTISQQVSIYPNPTTGNIQIRNSKKVKFIQVFNLLGDVVFESGELAFINGIKWAQGIYIVNIIMKDGASLTEKIIINR